MTVFWQRAEPGEQLTMMQIYADANDRDEEGRYLLHIAGSLKDINSTVMR